MKKFFTLFAIALLFFTTSWAQSDSANQKDKSKEFGLKITGDMKTWYEYNLNDSEGNFRVRNARLSFRGQVNEYVGYRFLFDFRRLANFRTVSDTIMGKQVLTSWSGNFRNTLFDAYVTISPIKNFSVRVGQYKIPFSTDDYVRSPATIDFANRPLSARRILPDLRDIGAMFSYKPKGQILSSIETGLFNGSGPDVSDNDKTINSVTRVAIVPMENLDLAAHSYFGKVNFNDVYFFNFSANYGIQNLFFSGEYTFGNTDVAGADRGSMAYFVYALYKFKTNNDVVQFITPAVRYESLDLNSEVDDDAIDRLTAGLTFSFASYNKGHIRFNYEKFIYQDGRDDLDQFITEFQVAF